MQLSVTALEWSAEQRAQYLFKISHHPPETLVFVDESACNCHTARQARGWAPSGDRAWCHDYFVHGTW